MRNILLLFIVTIFISCSNKEAQERHKTLQDSLRIESEKQDSIAIAQYQIDVEKAIEPYINRYEILGISKEGIMEMEYTFILIKNIPISKDSISDFVAALRLKQNDYNSIIAIVDNKTAYEPLKNHLNEELKGVNYTKMADRVIVMMSKYDDVAFMYPLQDWRYKEEGGRNWKREPIQ